MSIFLCFYNLNSIRELKIIYVPPLQYYRILYLSKYLPLPGRFIFSHPFMFQAMVFYFNLKNFL